MNPIFYCKIWKFKKIKIKNWKEHEFIHSDFQSRWKRIVFHWPNALIMHTFGGKPSYLSIKTFHKAAESFAKWTKVTYVYHAQSGVQRLIFSALERVMQDLSYRTLIWAELRSKPQDKKFSRFLKGVKISSNLCSREDDQSLHETCGQLKAVKSPISAPNQLKWVGFGRKIT